MQYAFKPYEQAFSDWCRAGFRQSLGLGSSTDPRSALASGISERAS